MGRGPLCLGRMCQNRSWHPSADPCLALGCDEKGPFPYKPPPGPGPDTPRGMPSLGPGPSDPERT